MQLKKIAHSLITRIILLAIAVMVFATVIGYMVVTRGVREHLLSMIEVQQRSLAEYAARDVDARIEERRRYLSQLAAALPRERLRDPARLRDWVRERHGLSLPFARDWLIADLDGGVLAETSALAGRASVALDPAFQTARQGRPAIGQARLDEVEHRPMLTMAVPIEDAAGRTRAVLLARFDLSEPGFLANVLKGRIGEGGGLALVSPRDKLIVVASDTARWLQPMPAALIGALEGRGASASGRGVVAENGLGDEELSVLAAVPSTGWIMIARLPTSEVLVVLAEIHTFMTHHAVAVRLGTHILLGVLVARLLRPLSHSAALAERMTLGEIELAPLPVRRDDEVGHLIRAFNRLLNKLGQQQAELGRLAHHDALTGLPNRKLLAERMQQALWRAKRNASQVAVLFMDLDGFKQINDTLGHDVGDTVLREVARRLSTVVRQADTVARLGGDEFVLLLSDLDDTSGDDVRSVARKCLDAIAQPLTLPSGEYRIAASIGIAMGGGESGFEALLVEADKRMYVAKEQGRGCYVMAGRVGQ